MANSVHPDETPRSAASHLGLYCLLRPICPNIYGKYGIADKYIIYPERYTQVMDIASQYKNACPATSQVARYSQLEHRRRKA